ncbi:MAG: nucleotidyl transferase AbiEii/AbiGii toxin family protein [Candidatus Peribacteria bacterium]|jgi:predicted nucleotidyltransferase component of viral defense system|nr:nucleotidyl transferase AbiEii/AbiGii toxin family protein [Candidatus Peribacteria bacterium]
MVLHTNLHRLHLHQLLVALTQSKYGSILGFKGGTLAYFLYQLPRFSTDLDFDLLGEVEEQTFLSDLIDICGTIGTVKDAYNKENTVFLLLDYGINEMNIKIEINKRTRKNDHFSFKSLLGNQVLCMEEDDVFTNKLVALLERKRTVSRDLFDVHFFLQQGFRINEALLLERTGKKAEPYLQEVKKFIVSHFNEQNLLAGLGEVINEKQKYFVKTQLVQETIHLIDFYLTFKDR